MVFCCCCVNIYTITAYQLHVIHSQRPTKYGVTLFMQTFMLLTYINVRLQSPISIVAVFLRLIELKDLSLKIKLSTKRIVYNTYRGRRDIESERAKKKQPSRAISISANLNNQFILFICFRILPLEHTFISIKQVQMVDSWPKPFIGFENALCKSSSLEMVKQLNLMRNHFKWDARISHLLWRVVKTVVHTLLIIYSIQYTVYVHPIENKYKSALAMNCEYVNVCTWHY